MCNEINNIKNKSCKEILNHARKIIRSNKFSRTISDSKGVIKHYRKKDGSLAIINFPSGESKYFKGPPGEEFLTEKTYESGEVQKFTGTRGNESLLEVKFKDGNIQKYKGSRGKERIVEVLTPEGNIQKYEGDKNEEMLKTNHIVSEKYIQYYEGPKDEERLVSTIFYEKDIMYYYEGPKDEERLVSCKDCDKIIYYEGERGKECVRSKVKSFDRITYYDGPKGKEYITAEVMPGQTNIFEGSRGNEILIKTIYEDETVFNFKPPLDRDWESGPLKSIYYKNGLKEYYTGDEVLKEKLWKKILPDGRVDIIESY